MATNGRSNSTDGPGISARDASTGMVFPLLPTTCSLFNEEWGGRLSDGWKAT